MRRRSLTILTVVLSLTIVSPSVYAGSQEPPIGPAPGPPKTSAEKVNPPQSKPSDQPERKRILEPPFDLSREVAKPQKPSKDSPDAKADGKEHPRPIRPSLKDFSEPNQSGPIADFDSEAQPATRSGISAASEDRSPTEHSDHRQGREAQDQANPRQEQEPKTGPSVAEAKPAGDRPDKSPRQDSTKQAMQPSKNTTPDQVTQSSGKAANKGAKVAASSAQTDRQLPRTEETPLPKTASNGPWMMIIGLLMAAVGWVGRKIGFSKD